MPNQYLSNISDGVSTDDRRFISRETLETTVTFKAQKLLKQASEAERSCILKAIAQVGLLGLAGTVVGLYIHAKEVGLGELIDAIDLKDLPALVGGATLIELGGVFALGKGAMASRDEAKKIRKKALRDTVDKWKQLAEDGDAVKSLNRREKLQDELQGELQAKFGSRFRCFGLDSLATDKAARQIDQAVTQANKPQAPASEDGAGEADSPAANTVDRGADGDTASRTLGGLVAMAGVVGTVLNPKATTGGTSVVIEVRQPETATTEVLGFEPEGDLA